MKKSILLLWTLCPVLLFGQMWEYPVKPGSEEWKRMDYQEKVKLSQPPIDVIREMQTEELFELCVTYPFNQDILLFNNPNDIFGKSKVWNEFIKRKDAADVFIKHYTKKTLSEIAHIRDGNIRNRERFTMYFLEKVVSETPFAENISHVERMEIMNVIIKTHLNKKMYPEDYSGFAYNSSLSAICKIVIAEKPAIKEKMDRFRELTENGRNLEENVDCEIVGIAREFLSK